MSNRMQFDVVIIGGGILGCLAARNLYRWNLSAALIEAKEDVCTGITRANSAIVYPGYDNQPGSLKASMTVAGNAAFQDLCEELEVSFLRRGSLMVSFGPQADAVLARKLLNGRQNAVPNLKLLSGEEAREMEPRLSEHVSAALYCPSTGTVSPWQLGIAAFENAVHNGCTPFLNTQVLAMEHRRANGTYAIETSGGLIECKAILNCAGLYADRIQEMLFAPSVRLFFDASDYLVMDKNAPSPEHIIFHESETKGKGITAIPTVEGNLLLESPARSLSEAPETSASAEVSTATDASSLLVFKETASQVIPSLDHSQVIRSFGAIRPNPHRVVEKDGQWIPDGKSIGSFVIEHPAPGFFSLIGIKTPGLTCADQLGRYLAEQCAEYLSADWNTRFDPYRKSIVQVHHLDFQARASLALENPEYADIICQCEDISRAEIREAILREVITPEGTHIHLGASTLDGIKRRLGTAMGRCQGSRCTYEIQKMLHELG